MLKKKIFEVKFIFIFILSLIFFIKHFFIQDVFFPSKFTCLEVGWFNHDFILVRENLELINKSYSSSEMYFSKNDYLNNFNWLPFWFARNYSQIIVNIFTILIPIICVDSHIE